MRVMKAALLLVFLSACGPSLPAKVKNRPVDAGTKPTGTWTLEGASAAKSMVVMEPKDKGQLWDVRVGPSAADAGRALSDGEWLYVMEPALASHHIALTVYERSAEGLEGIWGFFKLGSETAKGKPASGNFVGTYAAEGINPLSKGYKAELTIAPLSPDAFSAKWVTRDGAESGGIALEANGKLIALRWPLGTRVNAAAGITEHYDKPHVTLSVLHIAGDRMEGRSVDSDTGKVAPAVWVRGK